MMTCQQDRTALIVGIHENEARWVKEAFCRKLSTLPMLTLSFADAIQRLQHESYYLVWLEMPFMFINDSNCLTKIRQKHENWLVWSAPKIEPHEELTALRIGVDLCIRHPQWHDLALARIGSFIERIEREALGIPSHRVQSGSMTAERLFRNGELLLDETRREVKIDTKKISLSNADFELLCIFLRYKGELLSRDFLHRRLTGNEWNGLDRRIDQRIVRLRKKLGDTAITPKWILSIRGAGYRMNSY